MGRPAFRPASHTPPPQGGIYERRRGAQGPGTPPQQRRRASDGASGTRTRGSPGEGRRGARAHSGESRDPLRRTHTHTPHTPARHPQTQTASPGAPALHPWRETPQPPASSDAPPWGPRRGEGRRRAASRGGEREGRPLPLAAYKGVLGPEGMRKRFALAAPRQPSSNSLLGSPVPAALLRKTRLSPSLIE